MSTLSEIRGHIRAVDDTRKITRAMYLISSAKMKRARDAHDQNAISYEKIRSQIKFVLGSIHTPTRNPFFRPHGDKTAYVIIAGEKGLCGGYNHEILRLADEVISPLPEVNRSIITIGHMASEHFVKRGLHPDVHYLHAIQSPTLRHARQIATELSWMFTEKILDNVVIVYTKLFSDGTMKPSCRRLLPILKEDFEDADDTDESVAIMSYTPTRYEALSMLVTQYLIGSIYSALVQAHASEHHARMTAMQSATHNADEMLTKLRIQWGHARQAAITQEITEIVAGSVNGDEYQAY
ncbi:MAG: ATP synthase F1 subunit gamma [Oscillospiraceae bacterium]|jgi:F-type H+-transporting ATPase subunit gamma|nr:ATP synthase F1 subunit gamma [Oscillospiraceae bacterium]